MVPKSVDVTNEGGGREESVLITHERGKKTPVRFYTRNKIIRT